MNWRDTSMTKRFLELLVIIIFMPLIFFIFLIISLLIYIFDGSPIIFSQLRGGYKGSTFKIYKFRTMKFSSDQITEDSHRITKFGKFLRKTSIDELPSIYNVLIGEMSLVGPRPLIADYLDLYSNLQKKRHDVKPGITGLAQIKGRNKIRWKERFEIDVWYVENHNLILDIKIIFLTFFQLFRASDNQYDIEKTMYKFKGKDED